MDTDTTINAGKLIGKFVINAWDSSAKNIPYLYSAKQKRDLISHYNERRFECEELRLICERDSLDFERKKHQELAEENRLAANLEADRRLNEIIVSKELDFILKHLPIRVAPGIFKRSWEDYEQAPLHIFIAPPVGPLGEANMPGWLPEIERGIIRFCSENFNLTNPEHTHIKVMTRTWIQGKPCGQAGVDQLHDTLSGLPCAIIDTEAGLNEFSFNIACWGLPIDNRNQSTILQPVGNMPYSSLFSSLDIIPKDVTSLEQALTDNTLTLTTRLLPFYKLLISATADMYHLSQYGTQPRLPSLLTTIFDDNMPDSSMQKLIDATLIAYREIYVERAAAFAPYSGEILLELAETLAEAGLSNQALLQMNDAISCFCALRNVSVSIDASVEDQLISLVKSARDGESEFINRIALLWDSLEQKHIAKQARKVCKKSREPTNKNQIGNFFDNGDGTITDIKTGLMWKKFSEGQGWDRKTKNCTHAPSYVSWIDIEQYYIDSEERNTFRKLLKNDSQEESWESMDDWRVPTLHELKSIVDEEYEHPCINPVLFPKTMPHYYWTCTPTINNPKLTDENRRYIEQKDDLIFRNKDRLCVVNFLNKDEPLSNKLMTSKNASEGAFLRLVRTIKKPLNWSAGPKLSILNLKNEIITEFQITKENRIPNSLVEENIDIMYMDGNHDPMIGVPSYMLFCIEDIEKNSTHCEYTINALAEYGAVKDETNRDLNFKYRCSQKQRIVIYKFIEWCINYNSFLFDADKWKAQISLEYWKQ